MIVEADSVHHLADALVGRSVDDPAVPTPLLYLDRGRMTRNLDRMAAAAAAAGVALRPHIKSHKLAAVAQMQLDRGAIGLTVAKIGEAIALCERVDIPSVMIAQPYIGGGRLEQHLTLAADREVLVCLDDIGLAEQYGAAATALGGSVDVILIVDTGYGRLGAAPRDAVAVASRMADIGGIRFRGIRSHTGHAYTRDGGDRRTAIARDDAAEMVAIANELRDLGVECPIVSVGSTPGTMGIDPSVFAGVTEWRPGNYVFFDRAQHAFGAAGPDDLALTVITSVISTPDRSRARIDAGKKTLTSTLAPGCTGYGSIVGRRDVEIVALSEECGWLDVAGEPFSVGDRIRVAPNHACELTNLAEVVAVGSDGIIEEIWTPAARGKVW